MSVVLSVGINTLRCIFCCSLTDYLHVFVKNTIIDKMLHLLLASHACAVRQRNVF